MNTIIKKIITFSCSAILALSSFYFVGCDPAPVIEAENIKNVILFIGDGMGENHIENALTYFELSQPNFFFGRNGSVATRSKNSKVTDSAAAATAMATGHKVNNSQIAYHDGNNLTSISELALTAGKKVGVITTDTLDGATPASFSSHAKSRYNSEDIAKGQAASGIHLLMGEAGTDLYEEQYASYFTDNGYVFATNAEEMLALAESEKLIATLPDVRSEYNDGHEEDFQLEEMISFAMDFLENENGYFLMIESAHIDKYSHNNELVPALCETRTLFDCMSFLYEFIGDDTALILTADHETGGLKKAATKAEIADDLYTTGNHTAANVPLFIKNFTYKNKKTPQNTEIFRICKYLLGIE